MAYVRWHKLEAIDFILEFSVKLQKQTDEFKYQTFPRALIAEIEEQANKFKDSQEARSLAGKAKGWEYREAGMKEIEDFYNNPENSTATKADAIRHVQERVFKHNSKGEKIQIGESTIRKWVDKFLDNNKS